MNQSRARAGRNILSVSLPARVLCPDSPPLSQSTPHDSTKLLLPSDGISFSSSSSSSKLVQSFLYCDASPKSMNSMVETMALLSRPHAVSENLKLNSNVHIRISDKHNFVYPHDDIVSVCPPVISINERVHIEGKNLVFSICLYVSMCPMQ